MTRGGVLNLPSTHLQALLLLCCVRLEKLLNLLVLQRVVLTIK